MAKRTDKDTAQRRAGNRKNRNRLLGTRPQLLRYYLIVTDTQKTEKNYFEGLQRSLPAALANRLNIRVVKANTAGLVQAALNYARSDPQPRVPWIVFDRDEVQNFDEIIRQAEKNGIGVGWSNPCFEIWMAGYFGKALSVTNSKGCCRRFAELFDSITGQEYDKNDPDIYQKLVRYGNTDTAIKIAKNRLNSYRQGACTQPSQICPATTVFVLVEEIVGRCSTDK